eukprot:RCo002755
MSKRNLENGEEEDPKRKKLDDEEPVEAPCETSTSLAEGEAQKPAFTFSWGASTSFTTPPSSSPFQFPVAGGVGFGWLAKEVAAKTSEAASPTDAEGASEPFNVPAAAANAVPLFAPVTVETGEEGETTTFTVRAKLLKLEKGEASALMWREKGLGSLKVNRNLTSGKSRLLMRTENFKLVLNVYLDNSVSLVVPDQFTNGLRFSCFEDGQPASYCVRMNRKVSTCTYEELYQHLQKAKEETMAPPSFGEAARISGIPEEPGASCTSPVSGNAESVQPASPPASCEAGSAPSEKAA